MSARSPAHSMASMIHESWPEPSAPSTLPTSRSAPSATPRCVPSLAAPVPAIVEATWVPWPFGSQATSSPGTKLVDSGEHAAREVGVGVVVAGVEHGDGDAVAGVTRRPTPRGADPRHARVERRLHLAVEVDRLDAAAEGDARS